MRRRDVELEIATSGDRARITVPGGRLDARTARELVDAAEQLVEDRAIRVVTLHARSSDFCTGPADDLDRLAVIPDPASALARLRPPVVVAIRGACRSVGLEIVLATDVRVAGATAAFGMPDVCAGSLPCWGGTQRLARAIRPSAATAMLLLGDDLDVERAADLGLVHGVADDPDARADELASTLATRAPLALELAKEAVHRGAELPLRDGLRLEGDLNHLLASTEDRAEGLGAFFDKRPPDFAGR